MRRMRCIAAIAVIVASVAGAAGPRRAAFGQEAEAPLNPWREYVAKRDWKKGLEHFRNAIIEKCTAARLPDSDDLSRLYFGYNVCRYFPALGQRTLTEEHQKAMMAWMLTGGNQGFTEALLRAFGGGDNPARAFEVLYTFLKEHQSRVERYPELTIAFAVVWDGPAPADVTPLESFEFFTSSSTKVHFSLRKLPWQVSKYVIDAQRPIDERKWAQQKYGGSSNIGKLYEKIWQSKYDRGALLGEGKEIDEHEYTLENIRKYGGVCHDAAVFASEVGKSIGVPSVYVKGASSSGVGHAWIGYLKGGGWDLDTGRLSDEDVAVGTVRDPQDGASVPEHELEFALAALRHSDSTRRQAQVWCEVAAMLATAGHKDAARRAMGKSLEACVYDKNQWLSYARLAGQGIFTDGDLVKSMTRFANELDDYPGLAVDAFESLIKAARGLAVKAQREQCDEMAGRFRKHDEAVARVRLIEGQLLEAADQKKTARDVYGEAAEEAIETAAFLSLLDSAARVMIEQNDLDDAIDMHEDMFRELHTPRSSALVIYTTWFKVGLRLAKLHALDGDDDEHGDVLEKICRKYDVKDDNAADALEARLGKLSYNEVARAGRRP